MLTFNKNHYKELENLLFSLKYLYNPCNSYRTVFIEENKNIYCVLTVSSQFNDVGYFLNTPESYEIIQALVENDFIALINYPNKKNYDPENYISEYVIKDYKYLYKTISYLLRKLKF
jgi:hypothetical protein